MTPIIEVKGVGKQYKITHERGGYIALRDVIANIARKPFSFIKHKAMTATGLAKKEEFWALKNVGFTVEKGEVIGIIGRNGAGKSTLLKILSRITEPSEGEITMRGSVGSLLEVGTGFHPELTGRENIFLNGAILGMTRREIARKFDDIVAFSGVEKFIDTPVKRYSSGMYVRLAFSVAAHMEPDILLVDEVLAVGDAEFQKKCLGKMEEVTSKDGRTIIFVSHNLTAIEMLCKRSILLENGQVKMIGKTSDVIQYYLASAESKSRIDFYADKQTDADYELQSIELEESIDDHFTIPWDEPIKVKIKIRVKKPIESLSFTVSFSTLSGNVIFWVKESDQSEKAFTFDAPGIYEVHTSIDHTLRAGKYQMAMSIFKDKQLSFHDGNIGVLEVIKNGRTGKKYFDDNRGIVNCASIWQMNKANH